MMIARKNIFFIVITSIAGCILLILVAMPILGFSPNQIIDNEWANRAQQSAAKTIGLNQIPVNKDRENQEHEESKRQLQPSAASLCNKNCPHDKPSWMDLKTEEMSAEQLIYFFSWSNYSSCELSHDIGGTWFALSNNPRGLDGQKAVCIQPASLAPPHGSCIVYSFGINYEWSFDDAMEQYGCQVFSFDPSMRDVAEQFNRTLGVHFYKVGLGVVDEISQQGWIVRTLGTIRRMLNHRDTVIDYLKMDIEYNEWTVLPQLMRTGELSRVRQLAVEIHLPMKWSLKEYRERAEIIRTMERDHGMIRFDSKINPWFRGNFTEFGGIEINLGYEIAWYNKKFLSTG